MATDGFRKVLLVNYAGYFLCANTFIPDNSLGTLAAMLNRHGVPVEIVDLQGPRAVGSVMDRTRCQAAQELVDCLTLGQIPEEQLVRRYQEDRRLGEERVIAESTALILRKIADENVGLVGFKLWAGEGMLRAIRMAEAIRDAFPDVTLVAGGPAVQFCAEHLREITPVFDRLVPGEGEHLIVALARAERGSLGSPPLTSTSRGHGQGLVAGDTGNQPAIRMGRRTSGTARQFARIDELPFATYDPETYPGINEFYRLRMLDESRGCFNHCAFCAHTHIAGFGVRKRLPRLIVDEMERLQQNEGVSHFRLSGSNPPWRLVARVAQEILRRKLNVHYSIFASLNNVNPRVFGLLRESGLRSIFFGIESGDPELLWRAHRKANGSRQHVVQTCSVAMEHEIFVVLSMIVPGPFETEATRSTSLELIGEIFNRRSYGSVIVAPAFLAPGNQWWTQMEEFGFQFAPGIDRHAYMVRGVQLTSDYLLPPHCWADYGYTLNGRTMTTLLAECGQFVRAVDDLGVLTSIDDSSFMLSLMANLEPRVYKTLVLRNLVLGGAERLVGQVRQINQVATVKERAWTLSKPQSSAA